MREEVWKREAQVGNLLACCERERPIRVRKVGTSLQKGVGGGMGRVMEEMVLDRDSLERFSREGLVVGGVREVRIGRERVGGRWWRGMPVEGRVKDGLWAREMVEPCLEERERVC